MAQRVRFQVGDDHVGLVTLDRPDKLNATDMETFIQARVRKRLGERGSN